MCPRAGFAPLSPGTFLAPGTGGERTSMLAQCLWGLRPPAALLSSAAEAQIFPSDYLPKGEIKQFTKPSPSSCQTKLQGLVSDLR